MRLDNRTLTPPCLQKITQRHIQTKRKDTNTDTDTDKTQTQKKKQTKLQKDKDARRIYRKVCICDKKK